MAVVIFGRERLKRIFLKVNWATPRATKNINRSALIMNPASCKLIHFSTIV